MAEAGFRQRLGDRARIFMPIAAMFPDMDIVYRFGGLPEYLENHRALSHSFVGVIASGALLGALAGRIDEERRYVPWIAALTAALTSHQILDFITSFGTMVLYPFSRVRFFFDWVFIIDLFLSGILALFLILSWRNPEKAERRAKWGLAVAAFYIAFCGINHEMALFQLRKAANENQIVYQSIAAIPEAGLPIRWSGIIDAGANYYQVPLLSVRKPSPPFAVFPKTTGSLWESRAKATQLGELFFWFARYPVVHEYDEPHFHIVEFSDLRFYFRLRGASVRNPFVLRVKLDEAGNVVESGFLRS